MFSHHHQGRYLGMKIWTAPGPDLICSYWLKKTTALHLTAQISDLLAIADKLGKYMSQYMN